MKEARSTLTTANARIAELQAELDKHEWISVHERLPEDDNIYEVCFNGGAITVATLHDDGEWYEVMWGGQPPPQPLLRVTDWREVRGPATSTEGEG